MKNSVWAAVCGAVRDELDVRLIVDYLLRCREQGIIQGIVFSTWRGELNKAPEVARLLAENAVTVVETKPIDRQVGNIRSNSVNYWRQATQLQRALDVIPDDAVVLKTRTDRAMPATRRLIAMLDEDDPLPRVAVAKQEKGLPGFPETFTHQIAIFRARTNRVFQFTDFAFMGYSADMRKMLNFNVAEFYFNRYLNANMLFFIFAFVKDYPVIKDYERRIQFEYLIPELDRYTSAGGTAFPQFLERFYAVYLGILATHFRIGTLRPDTLGKIEQPIAFADFFHGTHNRHLLHSNLGTILNSADIVDAFIAQDAEDLDETSQHVLAWLHGSASNLVERATPAEVTNLQLFAANSDFSGHSWLFKVAPLQETQARGYPASMAYHFPGISDQEQAELWAACAEVSSPNRILLEFWLAHDIQPKDTPEYLASGAKDGTAQSILMMMRLLRGGFLSENDTDEILRVNNTQAKLDRQHNAGNIHTTCFVIERYLYLSEANQAIPREVDLDLDYYFRRYMTGKDSDMIKQALYQTPEEIPALFDALLDRITLTVNAVVHRRLLELALELTGQRRYWEQLRPLFKDDETINRGVYDYSVAHGLLIKD